MVFIDLAVHKAKSPFQICDKLTSEGNVDAKKDYLKLGVQEILVNRFKFYGNLEIFEKIGRCPRTKEVALGVSTSLQTR